MITVPLPVASTAIAFQQQSSIEKHSGFRQDRLYTGSLELGPAAKQLRFSNKASDMQATEVKLSRSAAVVVAQVKDRSIALEKLWKKNESRTTEGSDSPWVVLESLLAANGKGELSSEKQQHEKDAARLETIFAQGGAKIAKGGRTVGVEELSQQNQALAQLIKGMQLKAKTQSVNEIGGNQNRDGSHWPRPDSWARLLFDSDNLQMPSPLNFRQHDSFSPAATSSSSVVAPRPDTGHQQSMAMHVDLPPMTAPIPAIYIQPSGVVRPQFPNPEIRPSLTPKVPVPAPGVSEPGSTPEFRPFPTQPGTNPFIEVPTIAPSPTEFPTSTPVEVPPSGTPSEVPNVTPPSFTPPDLPQREVEFPTRAPPVPLPNTPPITPPGTPPPSPPPETTPIPPPGKPDPTLPPQTPPVPPGGTPPEVPPSRPPGFPGFRPDIPPEVPPLTPPPTPEMPPQRPPGPEILPPGFGGSAQYTQPAPRAAMWTQGLQPAGASSSRPVLLERRPMRPVVAALELAHSR